MQRVLSAIALDYANDPLQSLVMRGIEFEVVWFDQDVVEYQVTCSNGPFRGATRMYLAHDDLSKTAEILSGFPSDIKDTRDVQLGAFELNVAGGGIHLSFRCIDSVGHSVVLVRLRADGCMGPAEPESVSLCWEARVFVCALWLVYRFEELESRLS